MRLLGLLGWISLMTFFLGDVIGQSAPSGGRTVRYNSADYDDEGAYSHYDRYGRDVNSYGRSRNGSGNRYRQLEPNRSLNNRESGSRPMEPIRHNPDVERRQGNGVSRGSSRDSWSRTNGNRGYNDRETERNDSYGAVDRGTTRNNERTRYSDSNYDDHEDYEDHVDDGYDEDYDRYDEKEDEDYEDYPSNGRNYSRNDFRSDSRTQGRSQGRSQGRVPEQPTSIQGIRREAGLYNRNNGGRGNTLTEPFNSSRTTSRSDSPTSTSSSNVSNTNRNRLNPNGNPPMEVMTSATGYFGNWNGFGYGNRWGMRRGPDHRFYDGTVRPATPYYRQPILANYRPPYGIWTNPQ